MGNFIFGYNFVDFTAVASGETSPYVAANLKLWAYPRRHWRSPNTTVTNIVLDMTTSKALQALVLGDSNFSQCHIEGNATDVWTAPSFRYPVAGELTITKDPETARRSVYVPLTAFNYRYLRIVIPAQTPDNSNTYFRIGSVVLLDTLLELKRNPAYPYDTLADEKIKQVEFESGAEEDVVLGDAIWKGTCRWEKCLPEYLSDFWTINSLGKSALLVFYENNGEDWRAYVVKRRTAVERSWTTSNLHAIQSVTFKEVR